jgi:hypothetical protein
MKRKKYWLFVLGSIALSSLVIRLLIHYEFDTTALLYVGVPTLIAFSLISFTKAGDNKSWKMRYWNQLRTSLIIMLGSSVILFEGFLCVVMFMPIYFGIILIAFIIEYIHHAFKDHKNGIAPVHLLPVILLISSLEGVTPQLSFERYNEVSVTKTIDINIQQIKKNLQQPIVLGSDMPGFLSLFPMPYDINAETLTEGDIHRSYFRYHRWFITNTHEGYMDIKLAKVGENYIQTEILEDSSYLSHYLTLHGTLIEMEAVSNIKTRVTLTVSYDRVLDPAWYFGPLERFGVEQTAGYLIDKVIHRAGDTQDG